jgi:uncharacterized protein (UPF0276 family)
VGAEGRDRFGLGWRPELAAGIVANIDQIDAIEVMAEDWFEAPRPARDALKALSRRVHVSVHGVSLGLASSEPVDSHRLDRMARLVGWLEPQVWSEHLAFVRASGAEIGHLAAPPRTEANIDGTQANVASACRIVGTTPLLENIATLLEPPGSTCSEPEWLSRIAGTTGADLLLDLHNLHANATNFSFDPVAWLDAIPIDRVAAVHLAGGRWIEDEVESTERRLLDDHLHDVPQPVYELLVEVGARTPRPVTVIIERDGRYPAMPALLAQLEAARIALGKGRQRRRSAA